MGIVLSGLVFNLQYLQFSSGTKVLGGPAPKKYLGGPLCLRGPNFCGGT